MFHTPVVNVFIWGSAIYHDYVHYPLKGKPIVKKWLNESPWGHLFQKYD